MSHIAGPLRILVLTLTLPGALLACASRVPGSVQAAPVQRGVPGYAHGLAMGFDALCDVRDGRLRCCGEHPLMELDGDAEAFMTYGDGFSRAVPAGVGLCGLRAGRVLCWGLELDDDAGFSSERSPVERVCLPQTFDELSGVRELGLLEGGGCVVTADHLVRCWGKPGSPTDPEDLALYTVARGAHGLALGQTMGCAIADDGLRCWGDVQGRGEDATLERGRSVRVSVPDAVQVVVGDRFACARSADRRVFCWGLNIHGALGRGPTGTDAQPLAPIAGLAAVDLVASETTVCARTLDGRSFCWGQNDSAQLGLGDTRPVDRPTHVPALDGALDVALSPQLACMRAADGRIRCAGDVGVLGADLAANRMGATRIPGDAATHVALQPRAVCVSGAHGHRCYGDAGHGRGHLEAAAGWTLAGAGDATVTHVATLRPGLCVRYGDGRLRCERAGAPTAEYLGTHDLASNGSRTCFVDNQRVVQCLPVTQPAAGALSAVPGVVDAASLALTSQRGCALLTTGRLACWPFLDGHPARVAGPTSDLHDLRAVAVFEEATCVLRQSGELVCWDGATPLSGVIDAVTHLAANDEGFLVARGGSVYPLVIRARAVSLGAARPGVSAVVELRAAHRYACARNQAGEVYCWGFNDFSQFGVPPPSLQLEFTLLSDREAEPETPAMLECGPAPSLEEDDDDFDHYEDYDETSAGVDAP